MAMFPKTVKAKPTVRGLLVTQTKRTRLTGTIVPWNSVVYSGEPGGISSYFVPVGNHDEQPPTEDGRSLEFCVPGGRASHAARRLYHRAIRRDWARGEYAVSLKAVHSRTTRILNLLSLYVTVAIAGGSILIIGLGGPWLMGGVGRVMADLGPGNDYRTLAVLVAVLAAFVYSAPAIVGSFLLIKSCRKPNVLEAHVDRHRMQATMSDGRKLTREWDTLERVAWKCDGLQLTFRDHPTLRFRGYGPRAQFLQVRSLYRLLKEVYQPEAVVMEQRKQRAALIRCGVYLVLGTALIAWVHSQLPPDGQMASGVALLMTMILSGVGLVAISASKRSARLWHCLRRRRAMNRRPMLVPV